MSEITNNACRLCLNTIQDLEALNVFLRDIIQIVLPQIDCSNNSVICNNCTMLLQKSFAFKSKCLEIEDSIHDFKIDEQDQVNLEKILGICTGDSSKCIKICRTCLGYLENNAFIKLDTENDFKLVMEKCLPEINIKLTLNPVICQVCEELLKKIYNFITLCDESSEKIKSYEQNENLCNNSLGVNLTTITNGNDEIYIISDTEDGEEATKKPVKSNIRQRKCKKKRVISETDTDDSDDSDYHYTGSDTSSDSSNSDSLSHSKSKKPNLKKQRTKMKTEELDLKKMLFCKYCLYAALTEVALDIHIISCSKNPHIKEKPWTINEIVQAKATGTQISVETEKENMHKYIGTVVNLSVKEAEKTDTNKASWAVEEAEATDSNQAPKAFEATKATNSNRGSMSVEEAEKISEAAENTDTNKISNTVEEAETTESNKLSKAVEEAEVTDSNKISKAVEETKITKSSNISKVAEKNRKTYSGKSAKTVEKEDLNKIPKAIKKTKITDANKTTKKSKTSSKKSKFETDADDDSDYRYVGSGTSFDSSNDNWLSHYFGNRNSFDSSNNDWLSHYRRKKPMIFCKYCLYTAFTESALRVHIISCPQNPYFKEKPLTINEVVQAKGTGTDISVETKKENVHKYIVTVVNFMKKDMNKSVENTDPNETAMAVQAAEKIGSNKTTESVKEAEKAYSNKTTKAVQEAGATDSNKASKAVGEAEATDSNKTSKPVEEAEAIYANETSKAVEAAETTDSNKASKTVEEAEAIDSNETSKPVEEAEATNSNKTSKAVEEAEKIDSIKTEAIEAVEKTDTNEISNTVEESETTNSNKTAKAVEEPEAADSNETSKAVEAAKATDSNKESKAVEEAEAIDSNKTSKAVEAAETTYSNKASKAVEEAEAIDSNETSKPVEEAEATNSNKTSKAVEEAKKIDSIETEAIEAAEKTDTYKISDTVEETEATDSSKSTVEEVEKTALKKISKAVEETKQTNSNKMSKIAQEARKTSSNKSAKTVEKDLNKTSKALKKRKRTDSNKTTKTVKRSKTSSKNPVISDHSLPKDVEIVYNKFPFIEKEASLIEIKNAIITFLHPKGRKVEFSMIKEMTIYKEKKRKSIQQAIENNKKRLLPALEVLVCNHCPFNSRSNLKMALHCTSHSSGSNSRVDYANGYRTVFYCVNCVKSFWTSALLSGHVTDCSQRDDNNVFLLKIGNALHCAKCYFDTDDMRLALEHLLKCGEINTKP